MDNANKSNKGNVIAEIDVRVHFEGLSRKDWAQAKIEEHLNCLLCGTPLQFKHQVDHIDQVVHEEAHCSCCGIRNRQADHSLQ